MARKVAVGKNILEILTTGMYKDAHVIAREFVQNSVDSLECALTMGLYRARQELPVIRVDVDSDSQTLVVSDEGVGVPEADAWRTLTSIAASEKERGRDLGFRGIGRLAGLAYCSRMIIETSAPGETVMSKLVWDAEKLRTVIADRSFRASAQGTVEQVTTFSAEEGVPPDESYYRVTLENVTDDSLLDGDAVKEYLSVVSPVPFKPAFIFGSKVKSRLHDLGLELQEYRIFVNGQQIFKPYRTRLYEKNSKGQERAVAEVVDVEFRQFEIGGKPVAACWYSIASPLQLIKTCNPLGVRFRKGNIQVGDRFSMQRAFSEGRFHKYFIGELHILDKQCVPNGQRDYFEDTPLFRELEKQVRSFASELSRLCHQASQASSNLKKVETYQREVQNFQTTCETGAFVGPEERASAEKELAKKQDQALEAEEEVERLLARTDDRTGEILAALVNRQRQQTAEAKPKTSDASGPGSVGSNGKSTAPYLTGQLSELSRKERKLVAKIYRVIKQVLVPDLAENLIAKIQEGLRQNASKERTS
jgi:hypothetical protein